jgi:hypothetical protein
MRGHLCGVGMTSATLYPPPHDHPARGALNTVASVALGLHQALTLSGLDAPGFAVATADKTDALADFVRMNGNFCRAVDKPNEPGGAEDFAPIMPTLIEVNQIVARWAELLFFAAGRDAVLRDIATAALRAGAATVAPDGSIIALAPPETPCGA